MSAKGVVFAFTAAISVTIVILALVYWYESHALPVDRLAVVKDAFELVVSRVLLSMFTTLVTAVLTYVFGKQLVDAVSDWMLTKASKNSQGPATKS